MVGKSQSWVGREGGDICEELGENDYDNISLYEILKPEKNTTSVEHP